MGLTIAYFTMILQQKSIQHFPSLHRKVVYTYFSIGDLQHKVYFDHTVGERRDIIPQSSKTAFNLEDQKDGQEIFCIMIMKNSLIGTTSFHESVEDMHIMQTRILILFSFYNMTRIYQEEYRIVGKAVERNIT